MKFVNNILLLIILINSGISAPTNDPRMAIVMSKTSYHQDNNLQHIAMGWTAVAHMAGIPYDCLFLSDLTAEEMAKYDLIVFTQCSHVKGSVYRKVSRELKTYLNENAGNIIIDGPFAVFDEEGKTRKPKKITSLLENQYEGLAGDQNFRISVTSNSHFITSPLEMNENITQHLAAPLHIQHFQNDAEVLLKSSNGEQDYAFLSVRETDINRIVLISDFSFDAGVASFFRNIDPQVFYANQLYEVFVRSLQWALYGDVQTPFPTPQLSNANLTAIIRLDADGSQKIEVQQSAMNYLIDQSKESGIQTVYAFVSDWAAQSGWENLAPLARRMEDTGNEIGTHSKTHGVTGNQKWEMEFGGAIHDIETNLKTYGTDIGKVDFLINPGNTIPMEHYEEVAKRFAFFMTHGGGEQSVPVSYGNITWFTGSHTDLAAFGDTPVPDYQWFYDGGWSYSIAQITAYQESIFDHMLNNVGRGVVYNQMWHDYGITADKDVEPPRTQGMREQGTRIINESNVAMYDAMRSKYATSDAYYPTPMDLANKIRLMANWDFQWTSDNNTVTITLDLSNEDLNSLAGNTGGMGLNIENTSQFIQSVTINGNSHYAFKDRLVILPNLNPGKNIIRVALNQHQATGPRLTYISKQLINISSDDQQLAFTTRTKSLSRFDLFVDTPGVLINADFQEWGRKGDAIVNASVNSDRTIVLKTYPDSGFQLKRCNTMITDFSQDGADVSFSLGKTSDADHQMTFASDKHPKKAWYNEDPLEIKTHGANYTIVFPSSELPAVLSIKFE